MTIDSLLAEVGPILDSSGQFSHPSFGEVLAARQFADEINSEKLSIRDAYMNSWSTIEPTKPKKLHKDYRTVSSKWRPALAHLATMLSDVAAEEFINVISNNYFTSKKQNAFSSRNKFYDIVLADLALCARCIGEHSALHDRNRVNQILNLLSSVACQFSGDQGEEYIDIRSRAANSALRLTKSKKVAEDLLDFVRWCGPIMDYGYPTDDARLSTRDDASVTVSALGDSGVEIEAILLKNLYKGIDLCEGFEPMVGLIGFYGGRASLEVLTARLLCHDVLQRLSWGERAGHNYSVATHQCFNHFYSMFSIIKRQGFAPELIVEFNRRITEAHSGPLMAEYHRALSYFAKKFKEESGVELYNHLEKNKMQFWDYWMVYKPK